MSTDISIKAYQAYLNNIPIESTVESTSSWEIQITDTSWYAQIFKADSTLINKIFFFADISENDTQGNSLAAADNLKVQIWSVTDVGDNVNFTLNSLLEEYSVFEELNSEDFGKWYKLENLPAFSEDGYFAVVFKSNVTSTSGGAPKIFFTDSYRQDIFPIIYASEDEGEVWTNSLVETRSAGRSNLGAICLGYVGKEVDETTSFDSGDVTIGGFFSSKRGYPVFLYVENESSQTIKSIYIDFSMLPPALSADGTGDETNQSMMRWYYYSPATLPTSKDVDILNKTIGKKPILDQTASFVIFTQPDRLPPYPKAFFEENEMSLESNTLGFTPIYDPEGYSKAIITDTTDNFDEEKWAHFFNPNNNADVNPSYIDFTLEKGGEEVDTLAKITFENYTEEMTIRGFNNIVKYRNYYLAFAKYNTEYQGDGADDWWEDGSDGYNAPNGSSSFLTVCYAHEDDIKTWTKILVDVADSVSMLGGYTSRIIGIHDVIVKNTGDDKLETLFVILQVYPVDGDGTPSVPYFVPAYTMDGIGSATTLTCLGVEEFDPNDGRFMPRRNHSTKVLNAYPPVYPNVDADHKSARFISPNNNSNKIYITARNQSLANTENKFGLWEIDLDTNLSSTTELSRIRTSNYRSVTTELMGRGFDPEYTEEVEISYIYKDGETVYFGTNHSHESVDLGYEKMGQVYSTDDFTYFTQVIGGEVNTIESNQWFDSYAYGGVDYSYLDAIDFSFGELEAYSYDFIINEKVSFMTKVEGILHVWITPNNHTLLGTPFHIAHKIATSETKLLRKFPISSNEFKETLVDGVVDISDLKSQDMSKSLRTIDGGIVNGNRIYIYGRDGYGQSITHIVDSDNPDEIDVTSIVQGVGETTALITLSSSSADVRTIPTGNNDDFTFVKINNSVNFNTGPYRVIGITGEKTFMIEMIESVDGVNETTAAMTVEFLKDHYDKETQGTRWLMYDSRLINKAFDYYADESHNVLSGYDIYYPYLYDFSGIYSEKEIYPDGIEKNIMGVYDGTTIDEYNYYAGAYLYKQYPSTSNVTITNKRIGSYLSIVADVPSYTKSSKMVSTEDTFKEVAQYFGLYNNYSIDGMLYNRNVKMVNQNGVTYMICDNNSSVYGGMRIYKTYGIKQVAEEWGLVQNTGLKSVDVDAPSYISVVNNSEYKMSGANVDVSKAGNMTFISQIKREPIVIDENSVNRHIFALTNGMNLPQFFSYFYQIGYSTVPDSTEDNELVLKWANSWEDLYSAPPSRQLSMILGEDEIANEDPNRYIYRNHDFPTDMGYGFYRLESRKIRSDGVNSAEIKVKGLRFHDVNIEGASGSSRTKKVAISGIVYSGVQDEDDGSFVTLPENIIDSESGGAYLSPSGEIIISFPKEIYINEISFNTEYSGSLSGSAAQSSLSVFSLPRFGQRTYGDGTIGEADWDIISSPIVIDSTKVNTITLDRIGRFTRSIRVSLVSGVILKINNLKIKSIGQDSLTEQFTVSSSAGSVSGPELIVIDDIEGLIAGKDSTSASAFASFNKAGASLEVDLGVPTGSLAGFPINRISMNVYGAESTRTIAVDVWDGETYVGEEEKYWENIFTNYAMNYKYTFVNWTPEKKSESRNVNIDVIDSENIGSLSGILTENNSTISEWDQLALCQFRPNIKKDRGLTIVASSVGIDSDGKITVNTQMDEDGPFSDDIGSVGIIERLLNIDFPIKQIKRVRIRVLDSGSSNIRINGLKMYTPIIDSDGYPVWPKSNVTWDIKLQAIANK